MADIEALIKDPARLREVTKAVFDEVDKDHSGQIDKAELNQAMIQVAREAGIDPPTEADVQGVLKALDTDNSGTLNVEEFQVLIVEVLKALSQ